MNKSGTRFAPKIRQRRVVINAPNTNNSPKAAGEKAAIKPGQEDSSELAESGLKDKLPSEEVDPLSQSTQKVDVGSQPAAEEALPVIVPPGQHRRSSRLDSLNSGNPLFKSGFSEPQPVPSASSDQPRNRRLSTISSNIIKKKKMSSISESDSSFQAIKKRRMSSRSSISRKSGSAQRISIVSRMSSPEDQIMTATAMGDTSLKNEGRDSLFQRTDNLYERYTISNLKEIPKNITDQDSFRYLIDEENFTMADLCKPNLPIGEISDNFERAREAAKAKQDKRKKQRELRARAREQFKPLGELNKEEAQIMLEKRKKAAEEILNADIPEYDQKAHSAIQLKMNPDGTFIVDEESTVVDRHKNASMENAHKERMDDNPFENLFNSATYGRQQYTDPWTADELIKFYKALSMWGTDFNLISQMFPYRTRRQIKAKFVNEERKRPYMVELALRSKLPPDFDQYCLEIRKELNTLEDFNHKLQQLQKEHEDHLKQIEVSKQSAKEEDLKMQKAKELDSKDKKTSGGFRQGELNAYRKTEVVLGTIDDLKKKRMEVAEMNGQ